jgi:hypothetical protein
MAISKKELFNSALGKVGGAMITSPEDGSTEAKRCSELWDHCLEEVLFEHNWSSAATIMELQKLDGQPPHGYEYRYQLPSTFIRLIQAYSDTRPDSFDFVWRKFGDQIWTDESQVFIAGVFIPQNVEVFNAPLQSAVIHRLAYHLCMPISRDPKREEQLEAQYERKVLPRAKAIDSMESRFIEFEENPWVDALYSPGVTEH